MKENIILKTALKTLLGVIIALVAVFGVLSLGFPQTMASLCEKTGNYSLATGYASLRYSYTGDVDDLARCAADSVMSGRDENISSFCKKLVEHKDFALYCEKGEGRRQYVYSKLCAAEYRLGKKDESFEHALNAMQGISDYPTANALTALSLEVIAAKDGGTAARIKGVLNNFTPTSAQERSYNAVLQELDKVINSQS